MAALVMSSDVLRKGQLKIAINVISSSSITHSKPVLIRQAIASG